VSALVREDMALLPSRSTFWKWDSEAWQGYKFYAEGDSWGLINPPGNDQRPVTVPPHTRLYRKRFINHKHTFYMVRWQLPNGWGVTQIQPPRYGKQILSQFNRSAHPMPLHGWPAVPAEAGRDTPIDPFVGLYYTATTAYGPAPITEAQLQARGYVPEQHRSSKNYWHLKTEEECPPGTVRWNKKGNGKVLAYWRLPNGYGVDRNPLQLWQWCDKPVPSATTATTATPATPAVNGGGKLVCYWDDAAPPSTATADSSLDVVTAEAIGEKDDLEGAVQCEVIGIDAKDGDNILSPGDGQMPHNRRRAFVQCKRNVLQALETENQGERQDEDESSVLAPVTDDRRSVAKRARHAAPLQHDDVCAMQNVSSPAPAAASDAMNGAITEPEDGSDDNGDPRPGSTLRKMFADIDGDASVAYEAMICRLENFYQIEVDTRRTTKARIAQCKARAVNWGFW